ncbi:hypothetical protein [Aeromicrobium duanguangcaii]|nr:hypothetical protein [Aeromicrobium duanguangcaii]MCL3836914.1 hypothetical protein [Aeromicrobium duanguangcaii]
MSHFVDPDYTDTATITLRWASAMDGTLTGTVVDETGAPFHDAHIE